MPELPQQGPAETLLDPEPPQATAALADALASPGEDAMAVGGRLSDIAAGQPTYLDAWAHLAAWALDQSDPVAAYAYARTGYHRGLDRIRKAGWRGQGAVPWHHEPNRGFLRSLHALMRAAAVIGEMGEATRCRDFLLQLDPDDELGVARADLEAIHQAAGRAG